MSNDIAVETFKKNFNINTDFTDIKFRTLKVEPYHSLDKDHQFGEKTCLLYNIAFSVFNVDISLKILSFAYETHAEALKLEIKIHNELLAKEAVPCRNFLQRKRNINSVFEILIKFTKLFEMRRIICQSIFKKQPKVMMVTHDNGVTLKCYSCDYKVNYLEVNWAITWNVDEYDVSDFLEFYCNELVLQTDCRNKIKRKLHTLVQPNLNFQSKLKLWRLLMEDLYGPSLDKGAVTKTCDVMEILDSDSDDSVIEIDKNINKGTVNDEILVIE